MASSTRLLTPRVDWAPCVTRWQVGLSCSCTLEELAWGVERLLGQYEYVKVDTPNEVKRYYPSAIDWGDVIARLSAAYHQPPEYFVWKCGEQLVIDMLGKIPNPHGSADDDPVKKRYLANFFELKRYLKGKAKCQPLA